MKRISCILRILAGVVGALLAAASAAVWDVSHVAAILLLIFSVVCLAIFFGK